MKTPRLAHRSFAALIGLSLALPSGCAELDEEPSLDETSSQLLVTAWSAGPAAGDAYYGGQLATLDGTTYFVKSGNCGSWTCGGDSESKELYWQKLTPSGWSSAVMIPNQRSADKVSLAAFNGSLYMAHTGEADRSAVWFSRFDPSTGTWTPNIQLAYQTFAGPPALAAFDGKLHLVGTTEDTYQMWAATMSPGEVFSVSRVIAGHFSASRPSLAVYDNKLYVAHRAGETGEIFYSYRNPGTNIGWTADKYIYSGPLGAPLRSGEPVLAAVGGFLHLVFRTPESDRLWWTYFDTCKWVPPLTIGTLSTTTGPSLTNGGPGLVLAHTRDDTWNGIVETRNISTSRFQAPPAPITLPGCGVAGQ